MYKYEYYDGNLKVNASALIRYFIIFHFFFFFSREYSNTGLIARGCVFQYIPSRALTRNVIGQHWAEH